MTDKKRVDVMIDGRNFTIVGEENEEYIRDLAYYVDKKIRNLASKNDKLSQTMAATLAAIHIADELHGVKEELNELKAKAKDPLEKYNNLDLEFNKSKELINELKAESKKHLESLSLIKAERDNLLKEIEEYKEESQLKDEEIQNFKEQLKVLQDKNFKSQIELIETKKELTEYIRLLDDETSTYSKEGI
ncbi:MAG: cell division protein ZapA [Tissierellaceae bacterium]|nr:cell division protein ZapA [Tissierellaceae bacterium]